MSIDQLSAVLVKPFFPNLVAVKHVLHIFSQFYHLKNAMHIHTQRGYYTCKIWLSLIPSLLFPGEGRAFPIRISFWEADKVVRNSRASNMRYLVLRFGRVKPIIVCIT